MSSIQLLALICVFDVLKVSRGKTLKLDVKYKHMPGYAFGLFHTLIDENGQELHALVDTGSDCFYLVWKDWYEKASGNRCSDFPIGCYRCSTPCSVGDVTRTVTFADGDVMKMFPHRAKLTIGQVSQILTFGLIFDQSSPDGISPINMIGLGYNRGHVDFPSLVTQLRSSQTITTGIFALYLYAPADPMQVSTDGGLLLGGDEPALYEGALQYVEFSMDKEYTVNIDKLQVGDGPITLGINMNLNLDTGLNFLLVPKLYYDNLIKDIIAQTGKAVGTDVDFKRSPGEKLWYFPCQYMTKLPMLHFDLGPQGITPFEMTYMNYARRSSYGTCLLTIRDYDMDAWVFPDRMLIGNYFKFDPDLRRVGIGKLKPRFS
ncbi:Candidapepsin-6 precursor, putative [Perkinsus marinus ATCC 50983]|uniref:Candidapepsin-6, putative n=1 Tax=Perkinsus marinus (strain ATCC 50983 / TXsc) TaxID=423536 RepID=C5KJP5_PERM5|nr:Candidapepsin-6 precursor, putative [Perkinsus marinus ATCC 50983]EER15379.1 Candidapepsin-6 precursor, putative [Perkinsus marinus ATCC 50983]|eukprot:XP_002783583.1 Candidapepsin-6 precursor, putative [Perkinsus marinus ATCC 50983]